MLPEPLRGIPWVSWTSGIRLLGTPVGRASFVRSELDLVYSTLEAALDKLQCLGDPQAASHLLRSCLGASKVIHLLGTTSYAECLAFAVKVRSLLKSAWGDSHRDHSFGSELVPRLLTGSAWRIRCL